MATNENRNNSPLTLDKALDHIDAFIQKYLVCSIHHRTILALWVVHTYCYERFPVTPYLEISSPEAQSGKTTCLGLLQVLSNNACPWKKLTPKTLPVILQDPIHQSANQRIGDQQFKGFTFQHFVESWESYLPHMSSRRLPRPVSAADQVVVNEASAVPNGFESVPDEGGTVPVGGRSVPNSAQNVPNLPLETDNPNVFNTSVSEAS